MGLALVEKVRGLGEARAVGEGVGGIVGSRGVLASISYGLNIAVPEIR